jgi:hypothetical protein
MGNTTFQGLQKMVEGFQKTPRMPVLFIGHGSPMNAIEDNDFVRNFRKVATEKEGAADSSDWRYLKRE